MKKLFDYKCGGKLDKSVLQILKQRLLSMNQLKLSLINAVPWKDFEAVRQKVFANKGKNWNSCIEQVEQTIMHLGDSGICDGYDSDPSCDSNWSPKETEVLFSEITKIWGTLSA